MLTRTSEKDLPLPLNRLCGRNGFGANFHSKIPRSIKAIIPIMIGAMMPACFHGKFTHLEDIPSSVRTITVVRRAIPIQSSSLTR